jgi:hypothetical protein
MKTMAIRLDDEVAVFLEVVANLENTSQIDQIRQAIIEHLRLKIAAPEFAERAHAALEKIDRETAVRKEAISSLLAGHIDL